MRAETLDRLGKLGDVLPKLRLMLPPAAMATFQADPALLEAVLYAAQEAVVTRGDRGLRTAAHAEQGTTEGDFQITVGSNVGEGLVLVRFGGMKLAGLTLPVGTAEHLTRLLRKHTRAIRRKAC